jgi:hypothetical protein
MPTIELTQETEQIDHGTRWILESVQEELMDAPPYGRCRGFHCVFRLGESKEEKLWGFPRLQNFQTAIDDLSSHVGQEVKSLIESPPSFIRIDFADGAYWGVWT